LEDTSIGVVELVEAFSEVDGRGVVKKVVRTYSVYMRL
jgi:hypothetical protein